MVTAPKTKSGPQVEIYFSSLPTENQGSRYRSFEFKGMVNGGYIVRGTISDKNYNLLKNLIKAGYLQESRTKALQMRFKIKSGPDAPDTREHSTEYQIVNIISLRGMGDAPDNGYLEFIGIDPPSWKLNTGDGSGKVYKGNVGKVIEQVIIEYAPGVDFEVTQTIDSRENRWAMMRQDPKTFISSLIDWSPSVTPQKTHWIIAMEGGNNFGDNGKIVIKEQASLPSKQRAFYRYWADSGQNTIKSWELLSSNALSITETKIITQGLSAISGQYLDRITDKDELKLFAKDSRTSAKKIAKTDEEKSTAKPDDSPGAGPQKVGWTSINAIPEHNAGDLGIKYDDYIDGRARGMYLNLVNALTRLRLTVIGHGEWSTVNGLGTDTVYLKWLGHPSSEGGDDVFFLTGNWLVYGFHHIVSRRRWTTDLYVARYDYDSQAEKVGAGPPA